MSRVSKLQWYEGQQALFLKNNIDYLIHGCINFPPHWFRVLFHTLQSNLVAILKTEMNSKVIVTNSQSKKLYRQFPRRECMMSKNVL